MNTLTALTLSTVIGAMMVTADVAADDLSTELSILVQQQSIQLNVDATKRIRQALAMTGLSLKARQAAFQDVEQYAKHDVLLTLNTVTEAD